MNTRLPFLKWEPLNFLIILFLVIVVATIIASFYYNTLEPIFWLMVAIGGLWVVGIINQTTDQVEKAQNLRKPVGPDEVLSFSLEKEEKTD